MTNAVPELKDWKAELDAKLLPLPQTKEGILACIRACQETLQDMESARSFVWLQTEALTKMHKAYTSVYEARFGPAAAERQA